MRIIRNKDYINIILFLVYATLLIICSPILYNKIKGHIGVSLIIILLSIIIFTQSVINKLINQAYIFCMRNYLYIILLIWYLLGVLFNFLFRGGTDYQNVISLFVFPLYIYFGFYSKVDKKYNRCALYMTSIYMLYDISLNSKYFSLESSAREIITQYSSDKIVGDTSFWSLISILFPLLIFQTYTQKKIFHKMFFIFILLYFIFYIILSGYATAVSLLLMNIIFVFLFYIIYVLRTNTFFKIIYILVIIFIFIILFNILLTYDSPALYAIQWRLKNVIMDPSSGGYEGLEALEESRPATFLFSFSKLYENPFFGVGGNLRSFGYENIGGHSSLVDTLAVFGIFGGGGAFIAMILLSIYNAFLLYKANRSFENICNLISSLSFFISGIVNPFWNGSILFIYFLLINVYRFPFSKSNSNNA